MSDKKTKKETLPNFSYYFLLPIFFLAPFFISYIFTHAFIERSGPVSLEEEASGLGEVMNADELNYLYKQNDSSFLDNKNKIVILGYHQIREYKNTDSQKAKLFITSPEIFEKEMKYLYEKGYQSISLTTYLNHINTDTLYSLPEKTVIITFDDGYKTQYDKAFPILKKYNFTATFFIYSDCIDKYPVCMNSGELKDLALNNMRIANHTTHHVYLSKYNNDIIEKEITENEKILIKMVGTSSMENVLAYPFGANDERVRAVVKNLGYLGAVGVLAEKGVKDINAYNLCRYLLGNNYSFFESLFK